MDSFLKPVPEGVATSVWIAGDKPVLRLEWTNFRVQRDNFLVILYVFLWLGFTAATIWLVYSIIFAKMERNDGDLPEWVGWIFIGLWLTGALGVILGIPVILLGLTRSEWVEISNSEISFGQMGMWAPKSVAIPLADVQELFLGHCGDPGDMESFLTCNIYSSRGRDRWGDWLAPRLKVQMFELIEEFIAKYRIPLQVKLGNEELRSISRSA